jgi:hypothetical protein
MLETAFVFDSLGHVVHWHEPPGRSGGYLPDSKDLWDYLWETRLTLGGVAHSHPWDGLSFPSNTDVTTFRAIELGLGKRLLWPIVTFSEVGYYVFNPVSKQYCEFSPIYLDGAFAPYHRLWTDNINALRRKSGG